MLSQVFSKSVQRVTLAAAATLIIALPAVGKELGTFRDWSAFSVEAEGKTVCFMQSKPTRLDSKPAGRDKDTVRVSVQNRPTEQVFAELLFETGYPITEGAYADIDIDGTVYKMATDPLGLLWAPAKEEAQLIAAMRAGIRMTVKAKAKDGANVADSYSLSGFTAAMKAMDTACPKR